MQATHRNISRLDYAVVVAIIIFLAMSALDVITVSMITPSLVASSDTNVLIRALTMNLGVLPAALVSKGLTVVVTLGVAPWLLRQSSRIFHRGILISWAEALLIFALAGSVTAAIAAYANLVNGILV